MKMTRQHQNHLSMKIDAVLQNSDVNVSDKYRDGGLSHKRFRWDLLWAAIPSKWICDNLYTYINDDHIDTALRNIVQPYHPVTN